MPKASTRRSLRAKAKGRKPAPRRTVRARGRVSLPAAGLIPKTRVVDFTYRQLVRVTGTATLPYLVQTRLNSMFDFDYSNVLGNGQPMFYDQLCTADMYNLYRVLSWRTTYKISAGTSWPLYASYAQSTLLTDADEFAEQVARPGTKTIMLAGVNGGNWGRKTIKARGSPKGFEIMDANILSAAYTASPDALVYGNLIIWDPSNQVAPIADIEVIHHFRALLSDRRVVAS